jgi:ribokinase
VITGTAATKPDLIIVGQVTVDDVVPATPGPWRREIGGSSLYALAGARLWLEPSRIGLVARVGRDYPFDIQSLLQDAGVHHVSLSPFDAEHLVEWLIYEPDGSRRSLPRNPALLDIGGEGDVEAQGSPALQHYRRKLLEIAPTAPEIPTHWLPAAAVHLCPQVGDRHPENLKFLQHQASWISVDPSPSYSRPLDPPQLARFLTGATAFMPSGREIQLLLQNRTPEALALELHQSGFPEVILKRGADPIIVASHGTSQSLPAAPAAVLDPTGAGDSFCGAYAACRLLGHHPIESARRAAATAALVIGCTGAAAALRLSRPTMAS